MGFMNDQWGSRKQNNAIDCLFVKLLLFELKRHTREFTTIMAMDTTTCYDCFPSFYQVFVSDAMFSQKRRA